VDTLLKKQISAMEITSSLREDGIWVLDIDGYLDMSTKEVLEYSIRRLMDDGDNRFIFNCTE